LNFQNNDIETNSDYTNC